MRHALVVKAAVPLLLVGLTRAADPDLRAFIGTWKENPAKSRPFISSALTYTFSANPDGFLTIVRGGVQLRYRVRMDGKDYPTPGIAGGTVSWTKVDDAVYESIIKRDGLVIGTGRWIISEGGKHLTQETIPVRANGDNDKNIIEYVRTSGGGNSLLGEWRPVSTWSAVPDLFVVTLADDELHVFYPKYGSTLYTMRLDGKKYPYTGLNAIPGTTSAAETLGLRSLRRTTFQDQKPFLETVMSVSSDGKTMMVTTHTPNGPDEPSLFVYEKQD